LSAASQEPIQESITVVGWISDAAASGKEEAVGGFGGWFGYEDRDDEKLVRTRHRWKDYIAIWQPEAQPYLEAIRASVIAKGLRLTGFQHQHDGDGVPLFSDGKVAMFSFRGWADLMAAIWSEVEDQDYGYMDFYM